MAGIDPSLLQTIDFQKSITRIINDVKSDFIFAPHINAIYKFAGEYLENILKQELRSGLFYVDTPLIIDVPKASGLTRPGAILLPKDRLLYQILADNMITEVEKNLNREHVYSNIPTNDNKMFQPVGDSFKLFENKIVEKCSQYQYCIKTDVASYFETIYHHFLINQLSSLDIPNSYIKILEESILKWRGDKTYGILQGLYPSDLYGNYYLSQIDYILTLKNIDFVRYVDDIYIFSNSEYDLQKLIVNICKIMREQNLFINENKTIFTETKKIVRQQQEFGQIFTKINFMFDSLIDEERSAIAALGYGFQRDWDDEEENLNVNTINGFRVDVIEELYNSKSDAKYQKDTIIKFCLPLLSKAKSRVPFRNIKNDLKEYPHLTKYFASYLATIDKDDSDVTHLIEEILIENHFIFEYQQMWMFATLLYRETISENALRLCTRYLQKKDIHESIRSICAIILSKMGNGRTKKIVRDEYDNEPSPFVRASILYCSRYFRSDERRAMKIAFGSTGYLNIFISEALKNMLGNKTNSI
jgi:hypothetical protein